MKLPEGMAAWIGEDALPLLQVGADYEARV
jgi:hypothetical protein